MMSEELKRYGKDKDGVDKVMNNKDFATDALGQISMNTVNSMTGQMTYFYTTKVGMGNAMAGNIQLVAKLVDGVSDIIMGRIVDQTNTPDGKARPWLKRMIIPTFLAILLLFTVPNAGSGIQFAYGVATNIFASAVVYTAIAIPYYAMINYETKSQEERGKIGTYRGLLGYMISQVIGIVLLPLTNALGGNQSAWIIVAAIFGVIGAIALTVCFRCTKERYSDARIDGEKTEEDQISIFGAIKILVHNKYWWQMLIAQCCLSGVYTFMYGAMAFYCGYILGNDNLMALIGTVGLIPSLLGFLTSPFMIQKFGMRKAGMVACAVGLIGTVIRIAAPENMIIFIIGHCLVTYATAPIVAVLPAMTINCAEWNDYQYGVKMTGMTNSVSSFGGKVGGGLAGAAIGWILAATQFNGTAAVQSSTALMGIKFLNIGVPGILLTVILICYGLYSLEGKYKEVVETNEKRRNAGK
nr:glycoside-pentoside-hexuronide (GPH):cation symporter [uncultured Schaedlerella sp.]